MTESMDMSHHESDANAKLCFAMTSALKGAFATLGSFSHLTAT